MAKPPESEMSEKEIARRRDEVIKRMLETPPKPRKAKPPARRKPKKPNPN